MEANELKNNAEQKEKALHEKELNDLMTIVNKDLNRFSSAHPKVDINQLFSDEKFCNFAEDKLFILPLSAIYLLYQKQNKDGNDEHNTKKVEKNENDENFFTKEQVLNMSEAEVNKNFDKIRESMRKW